MANEKSRKRLNSTALFRQETVEGMITPSAVKSKEEVIMAEHIIFNGRKYYQTPSGYWLSSFPRPTKLLHRAIWEAANGEVPEGCDIHHIDENKSNNSLENLQCLTVSEHCALHARKQGQCPPSVPCLCKQCGKEFLGKHHDAQFCSVACYSKWLRATGKCDETRKCACCGKEFTCRKDTPTRFCSSRCAALDRENKLSVEEREEIRRIYKKGDPQFGARPLARRFGVDKKTIANIVNGK